MNTFENNISSFLGLNQIENSLIIKPDSSVSLYSRINESLRPEGGLLEKVQGNSLHSVIDYKLLDRPTTLIKYTKSSSASYFLAGGWDTLLKRSGADWVALSHEASTHALTTPKPASFLFGGHVNAVSGGQYFAYTNYPLDHMIYNDVLYLTDGFNRPVKYDGTKWGEWGYQKFTSTNSVLAVTKTNAAGSLTDATYLYKTTLYDSINVKESMSSTATASTGALGGALDVWVRVNVSGTPQEWSEANNYDFDNEFATTVRVYRTPNIGGAGTEYYLAGSFPKGLITDTGTFALNGATGVVTGVGTQFSTDGVQVGYLFRTGAEDYQVSVVTNETTLTVVKADGQATGGGDDILAGASYEIWGGFVDSDDDIKTSGTLLFEENGTLVIEDRDHSTPPRCKYCTVFNERAFMAGDADYPNRLYYSALGNPDYFPASNFLDITPDDGDEITGLMKFAGRLYIFKTNTTATLTAYGLPIEWTVTPKVLSIGIPDIRVAADCGGVLVLCNRAGVHAYSGGQLIDISHSERGSNIKSQWDKVVVSKLSEARAVYDEVRNEYILSVIADDERDLYNSSLAGEGITYEDTLKVAQDSPAPQQNNMALIYRLDNNQWFVNRNIQASCFVQFTGRDITTTSLGDSSQLYTGGYQASVYREDIGHVVDSSTGTKDQVTSSTGNTVTATGAGWTVNAYAGATVYIYHYVTGVVEYCTVSSNTADTITGVAGSFNGVDNGWTSNPVATDYLVIVLASSNQPITVKWVSNALVLKSFKEVKHVVESLLRVYGNGTLNYSYQWDDTRDGGNFLIELSQGTTKWGEFIWGTDSWSALGTTIAESLWSNNEGRFLTLQFDLSTSQEFNISLMNISYKYRSAQGGWSPS